MCCKDKSDYQEPCNVGDEKNITIKYSADVSEVVAAVDEIERQLDRLQKAVENFGMKVSIMPDIQDANS